MKHLPFLCLAALLCLSFETAQANYSPAVTAFEQPPPRTALLVGNSFFYYNNGIGRHLGRLTRAAGFAERLRSTMVTISGSGLAWHDVDSYFRPDALRSYSFNADNGVVFNPRHPNDPLFEVTILMDCSQCPVHPELKQQFLEYAGKHARTIRRHGSVPVFFMTWAYADRPEMTAQLAAQYTTAGNENKALVIPAGLAFARSLKHRPEIDLYTEDLRHPSLSGTYLAACTIYASLYGQSPEGLSYTADLNPEDAAFLQAAAWATVEDYYGK